MTETRATLDPESAASLAEFARACKAAARAVSLYPPSHPAIGATLGRLASVTAALTAKGPFTLNVRPHDLQIGDLGCAKADPAIVELAEMLRHQMVGSITLNAGADAESWHTLLGLLARSSEDVRADGGIAHLWATAGGPSVELQEIDYAEVLREKEGEAAEIERILDAALAGPAVQIDDEATAILQKLVSRPEELDALLKRIEAEANEAPGGAQSAALLRVLAGLTEYVRRAQPEQLDAFLHQMSAAVLRLTDDTVAEFAHSRERPEATIGTMNVVGALIERMGDQQVAEFVGDSVIAARGASERLAQAFNALVPEYERQRQLLSLAEERVAASPLGREESFEELWERVEKMLTEYSDARYVSNEYARELSDARARAVAVEATSDDPPERIAVWMSSVSDGALRGLDMLLLTDLLGIEREPDRWRDIAETAVQHAEDLVRVGLFDQAWRLVTTIATEGQQSGREQAARTALERFGSGALMKHVPRHLRTADDEAFAHFVQVCHAIGAPVIAPLAEVLATEQDARSRRRLRDILVGFGAAGRESVQQLMNAANWEVRRTAAYLLREFGGAEGLRELQPLLTDTEPLVQREAVQALVLNGSEVASDILLEALKKVSGRPRQTLISELTSMRDERAAPLFCHFVRRVDRRAFHGVYVSALEALGASGSADSIATLKDALHRGDLMAPMKTRRARAAAAQALRRIGSAPALDALREASVKGSWGVRTAARAELGRMG
jgi:HEAT repeat protein/PBS lyase HEAT-like repeat-containing protein